MLRSASSAPSAITATSQVANTQDIQGRKRPGLASASEASPIVKYAPSDQPI